MYDIEGFLQRDDARTERLRLYRVGSAAAKLIGRIVCRVNGNVVSGAQDWIEGIAGGCRSREGGEVRGA